jgi:hypothetical protein
MANRRQVETAAWLVHARVERHGIARACLKKGKAVHTQPYQPSARPSSPSRFLLLPGDTIAAASSASPLCLHHRTTHHSTLPIASLGAPLPPHPLRAASRTRVRLHCLLLRHRDLVEVPPRGHSPWSHLFGASCLLKSCVGIALGSRDGVTALTGSRRGRRWPVRHRSAPAVHHARWWRCSYAPPVKLKAPLGAGCHREHNGGDLAAGGLAADKQWPVETVPCSLSVAWGH